MIHRTWLKSPAVATRVGMSFLLLGIFSLRFLRQNPMLPPDLADGVTGLFYGLAIGVLLLGVRARRHRRPPSGGIRP
jgi:hypothetical protein